MSELSGQALTDTGVVLTTPVFYLHQCAVLNCAPAVVHLPKQGVKTAPVSMRSSPLCKGFWTAYNVCTFETRASQFQSGLRGGAASIFHSGGQCTGFNLRTRNQTLQNHFKPRLL